jgi:hypothetical protein
MDSAQEASNAADTSFLGTSPQSEDVQDFDASLLGVTVVVDPAIPSVTQMDVKANEASEFTELPSTSDNIIKTENISDKRMMPTSYYQSQWNQMQKWYKKRIIRLIHRFLIIPY